MESVRPDNRSAWAQQRGESEESFADFVVFRDLGPARTLADAQRLMGETQEGCKRTPKKRHVSGCLKRRSKRWTWFDRATAWDAMLEAERTAAIVAANRREGEKWVGRSVVFREKAWEELQAIVVVTKQLVKRPIMQVKTIRKALRNAKTEADAREVITVLNPALDTMRAIHSQTELAQLCFGGLNLKDVGPDGTTEKLTDEVTEGDMKSVKPDNPSAWAQQRGESAESFAGFVVFRNLGPARTLAEAQRLMGETQEGRKRTPKNRHASGCMKRRSKRGNWFDRATAWDAMLDAERTAAIIAAIRTEGEKWASRWRVFREDAWEELQDMVVVIKQLMKRPIMQVKTIRKALPNAKTEADAREVITVLNPALDTMRAIRSQTELAQLCFGDLNLKGASATRVTSSRNGD